MAKKEAFLQFLKAARSLQDRGLSKEAIVQFAKNEFGELSELFKKQIDSLFKPKKGIENIKIKDPDFDDTVVKMQFDNAGVPFNPKDPLKTKSLTYEEAVAKEKARAAADEDYIMKIFDPEDFAKGGRAGYGLGSFVQRKENSNQNQNMPAVDARMNLDYNTLVNQNEAQRTTQAQNRNPVLQRLQKMNPAGTGNFLQGIKDFGDHARVSEAMAGKVNMPVIPEYGMQTGYDFQTKMAGLDPRISSALAKGYQYAQEGARAVLDGPGGVTLGQAMETAKKQSDQNIEGIMSAASGQGLTAKQQADRNKYLASQGQSTETMTAATPTPDVGASSGPTGYTNLRKFYNPFEGRSNLPTSLEEFKSRPGNFEAQIGKRVGYSPTEYYPSFYLDEYGPKTQEGYDSMLADLRNFTLDFGDNPYERDLDSYQFYQYARDDEGNPIGKFTNEEARKEYDEKKAFRQSRYNLGKSQLDNYFNNLSKGGRAGYYTGGMVDVEPNLSDIGHGSDALMARTRLVAPDGQATTSTGLNYLLAEDNDNIRVPFADGNGVADEDAEKAALGKRVRELMDEGFDMGEAVKKAMSEGYAEGGRIGFSKGKLADAARRKFMKTAGAGAAGLAALKTGLIGLGEKAAPMVEAATETIKQAPSYFFDLASTIKMFGKKSKVQIQDRIDEYFMPSKDGKSELMLTEDVGTGEMQIKKIGKENDEMVSEVQTMEYSPGAARADESTKGTPADDYQEYTEYNSRIYKDEYNDPDVVDGINVEDITKELIETKTKKASGGIARMIGE